jgi:hypothetical protein
MDAQLMSFASVRQLEVLEAIEAANGSIRGAARALKLDPKTVRHHMDRLKIKAASKGYSPEHGMTKTVPDGFKVKGVSTLYDADGVQRAQWIKSSAVDEQRERMLRQFVEELCQDVKGKSPAVKPPTLTNADLLAVYPIGDMHHGMYADASETGEADYDCKIATRSLESAVNYLASITPPAETALLINVGDYVHGNDSTNETPGHSNRLDVDTRYGQVLHSAGLSLVRAILRLLEKHQRVIFWCMRGNHDPDAAPALALAVSFYFHNEPRVEVDLGTSLYKYMRFGENLIGGHHGHGAKGADLPLVMATDRKADWGETSFRVWHCGHIHHKTAKEYPGCVVETHRTLAPQDAWAAGKGYRAQSDMNAIIYHREYGEIQRSRFDLSMVK